MHNLLKNKDILYSKLFMNNNSKLFNSLLLVAAGFMFTATSCNKVEDLYSKPDGEKTQLLPNSSISSDFNWATTKTVSVKIAVNDQYEGKYFYKLELFDREPTDDGAKLLAAGVAKKGKDLNTVLSIPSSLEYIYVQTTNPNGYKSSSMLQVENGIIVNNSIIANTASISQPSIKLLASTNGLASSNTQPTPPSVPANAVALEGSKNLEWNDVNANKNFVIKSGKTFTGSAALNNGVQGVTVYVQGTWERSKNQDITIGAGNKVIVLPGGEIKSDEITMPSTNITFTNYGKVSLNRLTANSSAIVTNHGVLNLVESFNIPSSTTFLNTGTYSAKDMSINSNGQLYNEGTIVLSGTLNIPSEAKVLNTGVATFNVVKGNTSTGSLTNQGTLTVKDLDFTNTVLNVNCLTTIEKMSINGSAINITDGARLNVTNIDISGGATFNLASNAVLDVKTEAKFNTNLNKIIASGTKSALARIKKVTFVSNGPSIEYIGSNLLVATDVHPFNPQNNPSYKILIGAQLVRNNYAANNVVIEGTTCNAGGFNTPPTAPPVDQTPKDIVLGTYSYAFEDNWPSTNKGDYDMNDFVVDIQITKVQNTDNKVEKVILKNKIRAIGASKRLAAAIQLDNVLASAVKSVNYSNASLKGNVIPLTSAGIESGQSKAIVTIVDDGHAAFNSNGQFVFTHNNTYSPIETVITIEFNTPLDNFTHSDLNPFIINFMQANAGRNEVHLVGYKATDKINRSLVSYEQGANGELSSTDPFKTKGNEPFALSIPESFNYPFESVRITTSYPDFMNWVLSGGTTHQTWYTNKVD